MRLMIKKAKYAIHKQKMKQLENEEFVSQEEKITTSLEGNINKLKEMMGNGHDIKTHEISFGKNKIYHAQLFYVDGLADTKYISKSILRSLAETDIEKKEDEKFVEKIKTLVLASADITDTFTYDEIINSCLGGNTAVIVEGEDKALMVNTTGFEKRAITEPQSETVVRGPREGFTESGKVNVSLIRRKIKSDKVRVDHMVLGRKTRTDVMIMYIEGVVKEDIVNSVKERMKRIKVDSILESGYVEQYIEDSPFSPFATIGYTEKPDVAAGKILEGRIAIVVDGTPFVLTAPMLFLEGIQSSEDYFSRPVQVSLNRLLRLSAYLLSIFLPAIYVALTSFHQELFPTTLLLTVANAREGTPFPVIIEALIMIFAFEVLREAGIRLPRPVGQAISIVGALIMGEAAVSAGIVGAPMVITVAFTAVASFLAPSQSDSTTVLRLIMLFLAATLGFYGILMGAIWLYTHLCSLTSFGVPYFDGFGISSDLQDSVIRMPLWSMKKRPKDLAGDDKQRSDIEMPPRTKCSKEVEKEGGE